LSISYPKIDFTLTPQEQADYKTLTGPAYADTALIKSILNASYKMKKLILNGVVPNYLALQHYGIPLFDIAAGYYGTNSYKFNTQDNIKAKIVEKTAIENPTLSLQDIERAIATSTLPDFLAAQEKAASQPTPITSVPIPQPTPAPTVQQDVTTSNAELGQTLSNLFISGQLTPEKAVQIVKDKVLKPPPGPYGPPAIKPTPPPPPAPLPTPTPPDLSKYGRYQTTYNETGIAAASNAIVKLGQDTFNDFLRLFSLDKPVDIDNAPIVAAKLAVTAMGISAGIYFLATATDLLHPIKGTGIVPTMIDIVDKLGPGIVTGGIVGALVLAAVSTPLKYNYNRALRPYRPSGSTIDQMYFESNITKTQWHKLYEYQGWPDDLIDAQFKTMFSEPPERLLLRMFEDPDVPIEWIESMFKQRGYEQKDIAILSDFAKGVALDKTRIAKLGTLFSNYKKGYITIDILRAYLQLAKFKPDQLNKHLINAQLDADFAMRELQIDTYTTMFVNGHIQDQEFYTKLSQLIKDPRYKDTYFLLQQSRRKGKEKADKDAKAAEGGTTISKARFVEGLTNETQLTNELKLLNKAPDEIAISITEAKLTKELDEFKTKRQQAETEKRKRLEGKESTSIKRYVEGYTNNQIFQSELALLGKTLPEIKSITLQAEYQKDTNYRQDQISILRRAFAVDAISVDEFETQLIPLVPDPVVRQQILTNEFLRKQPKPKK